MEESDREVESANAVRAAGVILLLRGTAIAVAGAVALGYLVQAADPACRWAWVALMGGLSILFTSVLSIQGRVRARWIVTPLVVPWILLCLTPLLGLARPGGSFDVLDLGKNRAWLPLLSALFLPDTYALWTLFRRRGRVIVAYAMVLLCGFSSLLVAWYGPSLFLA